MFSPVHFIPLIHNCALNYSINLFIKLTDDTTAVELINNKDQKDHRREVKQLAMWCSENNFSLNVKKKKEKNRYQLLESSHPAAPLVINGSAVERVSSTRFLGVHIKASPRQTTTSLAKKAKQATSLLLPHTKKTESRGTHHVQRH